MPSHPIPSHAMPSHPILSHLDFDVSKTAQEEPAEKLPHQERHHHGQVAECHLRQLVCRKEYHGGVVVHSAVAATVTEQRRLRTGVVTGELRFRDSGGYRFRTVTVTEQRQFRITVSGGYGKQTKQITGNRQKQLRDNGGDETAPVPDSGGCGKQKIDRSGPAAAMDSGGYRRVTVTDYGDYLAGNTPKRLRGKRRLRDSDRYRAAPATDRGGYGTKAVTASGCWGKKRLQTGSVTG